MVPQAAKADTSATAYFNFKMEWHLAPATLAVVLAFVIGLFISDRSLFFVLTQINRHSIHSPETINQTLHTHAEAYILGDSRAKHHFDPAILNAEVGLNFFNAGASGYDILYYRCLTTLLEKRVTPKLYVVNISLDDFHRNPEQYASMGIFAPYMDESPVIRDLLTKQQWRSAITLRGIGDDIQDAMIHEYHWDLAWKYVWRKYLALYGVKTYRFNAKLYPFVQSLLDIPLASQNGFVPLNKPFDTHMEYWVLEEDIDLSLVNDLIQWVRQVQSKGIRVIFSVAPSFRMSSNFVLRPDEWYYLKAIRQTAKLLQVPLIEISELKHPNYRDPAYYVDRDHLSAKGAEFYSHHAALHIKQVLSLPSIEGTPYEAKIEPDQYVIPSALFDTN